MAEADEVVRLPGATPAETYLRIDALVAAARASGADAVHPGYGFLSEDAAFARACAAAGLVFVGPPPTSSRPWARSWRPRRPWRRPACPCSRRCEIPAGSTDGDRVERGLIDAAVAALGWPVLVKASAGGGGRGMRVVEGPDDLAEAVAVGRTRGAAAFGDGTVFLEPYIARPRHIEVQILGDTHGNRGAPLRARVLASSAGTRRSSRSAPRRP